MGEKFHKVKIILRENYFKVENFVNIDLNVLGIVKQNKKHIFFFNI